MTASARIDEAAPYSDAGRLAAIRVTCAIAGLPHLALGLFETGLTDAEVIRHFAVSLGVRPRPAPFPDLLADPVPRPGD